MQVGLPQGIGQMKVPVLPLFAAVPFGPSAGEYMAWIYHGGGKELFEKIYTKYNIKGIFCGVIVPEAQDGLERN